MDSVDVFLKKLPPQKRMDYELLFETFPSLLRLREYCASIQASNVDTVAFGDLLNNLFEEYKTHANSHKNQLVINARAAINRDLRFLLEQLEGYKGERAETLEGIIASYIPKFSYLRSHDVMDSESLSNGVEAPRFFKAIKTGDKLIGAIFDENEKIVKSILTKQPHLACYETERGSVLGEASWQSKLSILKAVVDKLPLDYDYGKLEGAEELPPILWAARTGQAQNFSYLLDIKEAKDSMRLRDMRKVMEEIKEFLAVFPNDPKELNIKNAPKEDFELILHKLTNEYYLYTEAVLPSRKPR